MKKLLMIVAVFAFALTVNIAFAHEEDNGKCTSCPNQSNDAEDVYNTVSSGAYSGGNYVEKAGVSGSVYISTGSARSSAYGINAINTNVRLGSSEGAQTNDAEDSGNLVGSTAGTGENGVFQAHTGGSVTIYSGNTSSRARGINLVNSNVQISGSHHH